MAVLVDYEIFIREWMKVYEEGGSRFDVAERLKVTPTTLTSRIASLKKHGVTLPELNRSNTLDARLAKIKRMTTSQATRPGMKKPPVV